MSAVTIFMVHFSILNFFKDKTGSMTANVTVSLLRNVTVTLSLDLVPWHQNIGKTSYKGIIPEDPGR